MRIRKLLLGLGVAILIAVAICLWSTPVSYSDRLVLVQAREELGHIDQRILLEPVDVQSVLLDYAPDNELVLKAWIALSKYSEKAREILLLYGAEPEFKEVLRNYGDAVIPPVQYFLENEVLSVKALDYSGRTIESLAASAKAFSDRITGKEPPKTDAPARPASELGPKERGWYAVNFIRKEGHGFLGQFVVDKDGKVKWNQTDRIVQGVSAFFTGSIRALETKYDLGEEVAASDFFWAGVDVAAMAAPVKLLRAGRAVESSGKGLSVTTRTRLLAPRLVSNARVFQRLGKYGAVAATAYIVVMHPSLINSLLAEFANVMGWNPWLVQFGAWVLIIAVLLYPFLWVLKALARLVLFGLSCIERPLRKQLPHAGRAHNR